jgi:hypothetical protein
MSQSVRLAHVDPHDLAVAIVSQVWRRTMREMQRLGVAMFVSDPAPEAVLSRAVQESELYRAARALAEWAQKGRGNPAEIGTVILEVRADLDGMDKSESSPRRPLTPDTLSGAVLIAAGARLALIEGRTVSATELATLADIDEHTVRAAVKVGGLQPVAPGKPMRFAADLAWAYLDKRGVPGFAAR